MSVAVVGVVGAGEVGCSLAVAAARAGVGVVIIAADGDVAGTVARVHRLAALGAPTGAPEELEVEVHADLEALVDCDIVVACLGDAPLGDGRVLGVLGDGRALGDGRILGDVRLSATDGRSPDSIAPGGRSAERSARRMLLEIERRMTSGAVLATVEDGRASQPPAWLDVVPNLSRPAQHVALRFSAGDVDDARAADGDVVLTATDLTAPGVLETARGFCRSLGRVGAAPLGRCA